jgi:hypothetical protein
VGDDFSQNVAGEDAHPQGWLTHCESSMRAGVVVLMLDSSVLSRL